MKLEEKLSELIKIETISVSKKTNEFMDFQERIKEIFPVFFKNVSLEIINGSMLMKWKGKSDKEPVLFMNHHDVVEAKGEWDFPPFSGKIENGKVYGRGTLDTKGGLITMIESAEELMNENFIPLNDIYFYSDSEEETDGKAAQLTSNELKNRGIKFKYVLDEGGFIAYEPVGGVKGYFAMIGVSEKRCVDIIFKAKSNGGHASTPPKNTPFIRLAKFMTEVEKSNLFKVEQTDTLTEMFYRMSTKAHGFLKFFLGHPRFFKPIIKIVVPNISPTTNALFRTTLAFTKAKGSDEFNVIPDTAYIGGNMRVSNHQGFESSVKEIENIAKKYNIEIEFSDRGIDSSVTDYKKEPFKNIEEAIKNTFNDVTPCPYIQNGASDSRFFGIVSDNVLRFVPFIVDDKQIESIHGLNENVDIDSLYKAVDFYKYLMRN